MSSQSASRVPAGVPTGGQFSASSRPESVAPLHVPATPSGSSGPSGVPAQDPVEVRSRELHVELERLMGRAVGDGSDYLPAERFEDVEADVRPLVRHLCDEAFDSAMFTIGHNTEAVSHLEGCEPYHVETYSDLATEAGIDPSDYPSEQSGPDEAHTDFDAFHRATIDVYEDRVRDAARQLVRADLAAAPVAKSSTAA